MNKDLVSYSHAQVRVWVHLSLKTKYCHKVFDNKEFRYAAKNLMIAIFRRENIDYSRIGFDNNHFHAVIDIGLKSVEEVVKKLKGISGKKLLDEFPEIKKEYFWGSGLWSRTKYGYSVGRDKDDIESYVAKQKYYKTSKSQTSLADF